MAEIAARLASGVGVATSPGEIESWARRTKHDLARDGALRAALEARGLQVVETAGDAAAGDAALAAGVPFVLRRIVRTPQGYRDVPALVTGYNPCTGLWLLQQPDVEQLDVALRSTAVKARLLVAVPAGRADLLAAARGAAGGAAGQRIAQAMAEADQGEVSKARATLGPAEGSTGVLALYRAAILERLADRTQDPALHATAEASAERSRREPPLLGFEAFLRGQAKARAGDADGALAAFDQVERMEGAGVDLLLARFAAQLTARRLQAGLKTLERAARLDPLDVRVYFHRGMTRSALGDGWGGRADLRRALDRRPTAVAVAAALAQVELQRGEPHAALEVVREAMRRDPALESDATLIAARRAAQWR